MVCFRQNQCLDLHPILYLCFTQISILNGQILNMFSVSCNYGYGYYELDWGTKPKLRDGYSVEILILRFTKRAFYRNMVFIDVNRFRCGLL